MKRPLYTVVLGVFMAVILVLSVGRVPELDTGFDYTDKLYHFAAYAVMGFLWAANIRTEGGGSFFGATTARVVAFSFAGSFAFGVAMELLQHFTGYRSAELLDAVANGAGGFFGALTGAKVFGAARVRRMGRSG